MVTRHAWFDNNYEGKLLRKAISKLAKRLKDEETMPTAELVMLINCISNATNAKKVLAQYEYQDKQIAEIKRLLKDRELVNINREARDDSKFLPG